MESKIAELVKADNKYDISLSSEKSIDNLEENLKKIMGV